MLITVIASLSFALLILILTKLSQLKILETKLHDLNLNQDTLVNLLNNIVSKQQSMIDLQDKSERTAREEFARNRDELSTSLQRFSELISGHMRDSSKLQSEQLNSFALRLKEFGEANRHDLVEMRRIIETNIKALQEDNNKKLEEMRVTVDEKLQSTLEQRLTNSFKQVSERLEQVHKGLGEMQTLATGVGDLKKVLSNVKARGTWGEIQLGNLLEQVLSPEQYATNVSTKAGSGGHVEFAIKLPGEKNSKEPVWLPIDSKFPLEDYNRLLDAQDTGDVELRDQASRQLESQIKLEARKIKDKYINPPQTTDFALMFVPIEGLYAEIVRKPDLLEHLQREHRVTIVGPTTLGALLNALQMGFRTLAIQEYSSQVWKYLSEVKKHFGAFGELLDKAQDRVQQASKVIDEAGKRSRTIEARLKKVQEITDGDSEEPLLSFQNN
jgi:DNA recombination protein RmuC